MMPTVKEAVRTLYVPRTGSFQREAEHFTFAVGRQERLMIPITFVCCGVALRKFIGFLFRDQRSLI